MAEVSLFVLEGNRVKSDSIAIENDPEMMFMRFPHVRMFDDFVGSGTFSTVFCAKRRLDGALYAVKKISKRILSESEGTLFIREPCALASLSGCPNLLRYFGCWIDDGHLHIQTEFCDKGSMDCFVPKAREGVLCPPSNGFDALVPAESNIPTIPNTVDRLHADAGQGSCASYESSITGLHCAESRIAGGNRGVLSQLDYMDSGDESDQPVVSDLAFYCSHSGYADAMQSLGVETETHTSNSNSNSNSNSCSTFGESNSVRDFKEHLLSSAICDDVGKSSKGESLSFLKRQLPSGRADVQQADSRPDADSSQVGQVTESLVWVALHKMAEALQYMHEKGNVAARPSFTYSSHQPSTRLLTLISCSFTPLHITITSIRVHRHIVRSRSAGMVHLDFRPANIFITHNSERVRGSQIPAQNPETVKMKTKMTVSEQIVSGDYSLRLGDLGHACLCDDSNWIEGEGR